MGKIEIWCVDWRQKLTNQNEKIIFPQVNSQSEAQIK